MIWDPVVGRRDQPFLSDADRVQYDKEVYNGDIAYIETVDHEAGEIVARFDGRSVTYRFGELDVLVPAYAVTIHKSQGSEYPAIIIPIMTQH
jgi:exodeoxyribonuclease V alpha subunit